MPLTLYYLAASPPVRSVDLVIHALDLKAEYKTVNLFENEQFSPEFTKLNPLHTVPMIEDEDGFVLWESRAIMTYLVSKYGKNDSLYPKDLKKRAIVDQRLHYSNDVFYAMKLVTKSLLLENAKTISDEKFARIREMQESVEKLLRGSKFIAGDTLTVADYSFVTIVDVLEDIYPTHNKYPLTEAWFELCKSMMKGFDTINTFGANQLFTLIKQKQLK